MIIMVDGPSPVKGSGWFSPKVSDNDDPQGSNYANSPAHILYNDVFHSSAGDTPKQQAAKKYEDYTENLPKASKDAYVKAGRFGAAAVGFAVVAVALNPIADTLIVGAVGIAGLYCGATALYNLVRGNFYSHERTQCLTDLKEVLGKINDPEGFLDSTFGSIPQDMRDKLF